MGDTINTLERYTINTVGDTISAMEDIQYSGGKQRFVEMISKLLVVSLRSTARPSPG